MGEPGELDFFHCGALSSRAASSFTFEHQADNRASRLIVGTDPTFDRLVPIPDGRADIAQRMDVMAQAETAQAAVHAEFVPKTQTDSIVLHQAVAACISALDAVLNSNAIMLKNGRDMHRSQSSNERALAEHAEHRRQKRTAFYDMCVSAESEGLFTPDVDDTRAAIMASAAASNLRTGMPVASDFTMFSQGSQSMQLNGDTGSTVGALHSPETARRAAAVALFSKLYSGKTLETGRGKEELSSRRTRKEKGEGTLRTGGPAGGVVMLQLL